MNRFEPIPFEDYQRVTAASAKSGPSFTRTNTTIIMATQFEPIRWTVDGYVPEGFSVLAGRQKLGKTWLAIDWALAVATGGAAMGSIACDPGDVLYIDMENGFRRIQRRIDTLYPYGVARPDLSRLEWVTDAPTLDRGFIDALEDWRVSVADPRLVIIDVLQRIKPPGTSTRNSYENDYSAWAPLQRWATDHGIAVVGLHHTRKGGADDPLESLSGSNGLSACADTTLVLDRDGNGTTLYVRGRDVDEKETALAFSGGLWSITGDAAKVRMTTERTAILSALEDATEAMSPGELSIACMVPRNNIDQLLFKMAKAGEVLKAGRGRYVHPQRGDLMAGDAASADKEEKKIRKREADISPNRESLVAEGVDASSHPPPPTAELIDLTVRTVLMGGEEEDLSGRDKGERERSMLGWLRQEGGIDVNTRAMTERAPKWMREPEAREATISALVERGAITMKTVKSNRGRPVRLITVLGEAGSATPA